MWSYEGQVELADVGFRCGHLPPPVVMVVAIWDVAAIITCHQVGGRAYLASRGVCVVCVSCVCIGFGRSHKKDHHHHSEVVAATPYRRMLPRGGYECIFYLSLLFFWVCALL